MLIPARRINLGDYGMVDLGESLLDDELKAAVKSCKTAAKIAAAERLASHVSVPNLLSRVSPEALDEILASNDDIHGISSHRHISNEICFGFKHIEDAIIDEEVEKARHKIDLLMQERVKEIFNTWKDLKVICSALLWFPPESAMGWHTNRRAPDWRIYIIYSEDEGESYFRYRDQDTAQIVTLKEPRWTMRAFRLTDTNPLWHCVYSNTNRISLGYRVMAPSFKGGVLKKIKKVVGLS